MLRREFLKTSIAAAGFLAAPNIVKAAGQRVLKFAPQADLALLDPAFTAYVTRHHALMVFDQLFGLDENFQPVPQMLEGAVQENDGRLWRFTLRPGLAFHDGEPVRSKDCIASIRRWGNADPLGQTLMAQVDAMAAESDSVFTIRLKQPFPLLPHVFAKLSTPLLVIMPERLANTPAGTRLTEMVGSGPFRFKADERIAGARNVYERFAGYKPRESGVSVSTAGPKVAHFDRVEWLTMSDVATAASALQQGEIDWWEYASNDLIPTLKKNKNVRTPLTGSLGFMASALINPLHPPMDNPAFRRVLLDAFNQADIMTAVAGTDPNMWKDGTGIYTPGTEFASKAGMEKRISVSDIAGLKRALAASGYKGEKVVLLGASDLAIIQAMCDVADSIMRTIGINVDYQISDWGTVITRRNKREPLEQGGWSMMVTSVDGIEQITPLTHRYIRGIGPTAPTGWLKSPEIEAIWSAFSVEPDASKRKDLAHKLQVQVFNDVPSIPCGQYMQNTALRADLSGKLDGATLFWNIRRNT